MEAATPIPRGLPLSRSPRLLAALGDDRLVEQARRGNTAAFEALYDRHHRGILSFCRHMLGSREEAEDAVQHTFTAAHRSLITSDRSVQLKAWLYTVARNRCLSVLRARRVEVAAPEEIATAGLSEEVERRAELRELLGDMAGLPERQRAALVLSEIGSLAHTEVAQVLECEPSQVKSLVFQARTALIEGRKARAIPCAEIREQLANATGGVLRRGPLRKHVRTCAGCTEFQSQVRGQRRMVAAVLPVIPTLGLKETALAATTLGAGGGAAAGAGGVASGGFAAVLGGKGVATVAAAVVLAGGGAGTYDATHDGGIIGPDATTPAQAASGGGPGSAQPGGAAADDSTAADDRGRDGRPGTARGPGGASAHPEGKADRAERKEARAERKRARAKQRRSRAERRQEAKRRHRTERPSERQSRKGAGRRDRRRGREGPSGERRTKSQGMPDPSDEFPRLPTLEPEPEPELPVPDGGDEPLR